MKKYLLPVSGGIAFLLAMACGGGGNYFVGSSTPTTYDFSRTASEGGATSVSYKGQIARHIANDILKAYTGELEYRSDSSANVLSSLANIYWNNAPFTLSTYYSSYTSLTSQANITDISSSSLGGKVAGNDAVTDHIEWESGTSFKGWSDNDLTSLNNAPVSVTGNLAADITTPEGFIWAMFHKLADQVNTPAISADNLDIRGLVVPAYSTAKRQNLQQLLQKFIWGAVAYSQATDDYLDDADFNKGLRASSNVLATGKDYTNLEHAWDEAYGYFGAPRDYGKLDDANIKDGLKNYFNDTNEDSSMDLTTEKIFGHARYAGVIDNASGGNLDLTGIINDAFLTGRQIISKGLANDGLTSAQRAEVALQREIIVTNWERVILRTAVSYVETTVGLIEQIIADDAAPTLTNDQLTSLFDSYGKAWSELKGFALSFQFSPDSSFDEADFINLHNLIGDAPVLVAGQLQGFADNIQIAGNTMLAKAEAPLLIDAFSGAQISGSDAGDGD